MTVEGLLGVLVILALAAAAVMLIRYGIRQEAKHERGMTERQKDEEWQNKQW